MTRPPLLTGDPRTDRALLALARLLAEIASNQPENVAVPAARRPGNGDSAGHAAHPPRAGPTATHLELDGPQAEGATLVHRVTSTSEIGKPMPSARQ